MLARTFRQFTQIPVFTKAIWRFFDMHEYQSKMLMRKFKVNVQPCEIATSADQAFEIAKNLSETGPLVLKAQVHAGGCGKGKNLEKIY